MHVIPLRIFVGFVVALAAVTNVDGGQLPNNTLNVWNPGARCLHRSDPATLLTSICSGWINQEMIYVDDYQPLRLAKAQERVGAVSSTGVCVDQSYRMYCATLYRPCLMVELPGYGLIAVGQPMCEQMCEARFDVCLDQYIAFGLSPFVASYTLNCTYPWPYDFGFNLQQVFQPSNFTLNITVTNATGSYSGEVFFPHCFDGNKNVSGDFNKIFCLEGTYNDGETSCALNCPQPIVTSDEYRAADIMLYIVGWLSFVLSAFVVVSYLINPREKLVFPNTMTFFFVCCVMGISFVFVLGSFVQQENMRCADKHSPNSWGDGWCTVQGVTYAYFTLAGALWWLSIGINMLVTIAFSYKPRERKLLTIKSRSVMQSELIQAVLHAVCWGIPLIVVIVALGNHKIGYNPSDFWCTIHSGEEIRFVLGDVLVELSGVTAVTKVDLWNLLLLTIPIFCITLIGTVILILVAVFAWIKSRQGLLFIKDQWRLLALMSLYLYVYSFVFGYRVQITSARQEQYQNYLDLINCQKYSPEQADQRCSLATEVVYPVWIIAAFNVAGQGIFVFLIYGTSRGVARSWGALFRLCGIKVPKVYGSSYDSSGPTAIPGVKVAGTKMTSLSGQVMADEISTDEEGMDNTTVAETEHEMDNIERGVEDRDTTYISDDDDDDDDDDNNDEEDDDEEEDDEEDDGEDGTVDPLGNKHSSSSDDN
eukprot:TRINITY_DN835_c0_g1_i7.p1 TRINITY_DN835_c0_g1~~TRINITY_DN835_c0_g1_i7.p1  ORF type:complete len:705 (+),score=95.01 TRINITY_DN835_c0_g1_i7:54-2168(+)